MATLTHAESQMYSWWWNSHISPKNSKWLQENLADMDMKVREMIKLIEEDADSFARRAEMYYKKRPELMKLVEEFYRAYRALAERYDHATGALRQAHRTMAEAFPNQIPVVLPDDSPSGVELEAHPPEMSQHSRMLFVADDSIKTNGAYSEENGELTIQKALKQLLETNGKLSEGNMIKGLDFREEEGYESKTHNEFLDLQKNDSGEQGDTTDQIRCLKEEISRLSKENQNLKNQFTSELVHADRAEAEARSLKASFSKLEPEKEATLDQYQQLLERIFNLEAKVSHTHEESKKHNNNMLRGLGEEIHQLKEENGSLNKQNLSSDLKIKTLQDELGFHEEQRKTLWQEISFLQDHRIDLDEKHDGLTKQINAVSLNVESLQDSVKELQDGNVHLKELCKKHEDEKILHLKNMEKISERNAVLENSFSDANVELEGLREKIKKLEALCESLHDKISLHISEKAVLVSQIEAIAQNMEKLSDKNTFLENSLSNVNVELESLSQKLKGLEGSYQSLSNQKSILLAEKNAFVSQVETINQSLKNMEKRYAVLEEKHSNLEKKNDLTLLQVTELRYAVLEEKHSNLEKKNDLTLLQVETINQSLKNMEKRYAVLEEKHSNLEKKNDLTLLQVTELRYAVLEEKHSNLEKKNDLTLLQVETINQSLKNMEKRYAVLEEKHSNLEKKNDLTLLQVTELHDLLKLEKQEHETLIQSSKIKLLTLENQIHVLQKEGQLREEEFEVEQHKTMNAQIANFILKRCMCDMKEKNMILSLECQKLLEKSRCAEQQISKLEQEHLSLREKITMLLEQNEKLRKEFHLIMEALNVNKGGGSSDGGKDESLMLLILCEIRRLLNTISNTEDENQVLLLEKSIVILLLKQFGLDMADLRLHKEVLEQESKTKIEELAVLQNKKHELLKMNKQLMLDLQFSNQREEALKFEKEILCQKLSDVQKTCDALLKENCCLSKKIYDMSEKKHALEQENTVTLAEAMTLEHLYLILRSYNAERLLDLKSLADDIDYLREIKNGLDDKVRKMDERMSAVELENIHLKDSIINLEDDLKKASLQVETRNGLLQQKDMELSQANRKFQLSEDKNEELHKEVEDLKGREEHLTFELKKGSAELQRCEMEFAALLGDIQIAIAHSKIFEEKILELLEACDSLEISALVQREMLLGEIACKNSHANELKDMLSAFEDEHRRLKANLNAHLPLIMSLWESIASLEESTLSLAKHHTSTFQEDQVDRNSHELNEDHDGVAALSGVLQLQKLLAKMEELEKVIADTESLLQKERFDSKANLAAAQKEIEALKSEGRSGNGKPDKGSKLQEDHVGISQVNNNQIMKDILLDHIRSSPYKNRVSSATQDVQDDDQMLGLWEIAKGHGSERQRVGQPKDERSNHPSSEIVLEKELSIDKLEVPKKVAEPYQEWNRRVLEKLASDAERLSLLQTSVDELKGKMELFHVSNHPTSFEFQTVRVQLRDAEAAICQLIDFNNRLTKKAEDFFESTESLAADHDEKGVGNASRNQISDRARKGSERIGGLELDLQKIQYILLKLEEEHKYNRAKAAEKRGKVLLEDYLNERRDGHKERKAPFCCACFRPSTKHD